MPASTVRDKLSNGLEYMYSCSEVGDWKILNVAGKSGVIR
jgi:hypothetical protein